MTLADCKQGDRVKVHGEPYNVGACGHPMLGPEVIACYPQNAQGVMKLYPIFMWPEMPCEPDKRGRKAKWTRSRSS